MKNIFVLDKANANVSDQIKSEDDRQTIIYNATLACENLLHTLGIDTANDPNTRSTAQRIAKMLVNELLHGKYDPMPDITEFPNTSKLDQLYTVGPVSITSMCSHHFLPFTGHLWLGILPDINSKDSKVLGLSKFARLADWIFARPQIQEEATTQLADLVEKLTGAAGIGLVVKAQHACTNLRGAKQPGMFMTTSIFRGVLLDNPTARQEFLSMVGM